MLAIETGGKLHPQRVRALKSCFRAENPVAGQIRLGALHLEAAFRLPHLHHSFHPAAAPH